MFYFLLHFVADQLSQHLLDRSSRSLNCRIGRSMAVDERSKVIFFDPSRSVAVATSFVGRSTSNPHLVVRVTFARAAPPAYDKIWF